MYILPVVVRAASTEQLLSKQFKDLCITVSAVEQFLDCRNFLSPDTSAGFGIEGPLVHTIQWELGFLMVFFCLVGWFL